MVESKKTPQDEKLEQLNKQILSKLKAKNIRPIFREDYFSNKQLNDLREVLEMKGFAMAKQFQRARIQPKANKWDQLRNSVLLEYLEGVEELQLDLVSSAFLIGRLNPIILAQLKDK